jgi:hypothetical protein
MFAKLEYRAMDTCRSEGKVISQIHRLLDEIGVTRDERFLPTDALTGRAALQFVVRWTEDGKEYDAKIQKMSTEQDGLANNLAAIHLWLEGRCLNIRRGVEKPGEAFGPTREHERICRVECPDKGEGALGAEPSYQRGTEDSHQHTNHLNGSKIQSHCCV